MSEFTNWTRLRPPHYDFEWNNSLHSPDVVDMDLEALKRRFQQSESYDHRNSDYDRGLLSSEKGKIEEIVFSISEASLRKDYDLIGELFFQFGMASEISVITNEANSGRLRSLLDAKLKKKNYEIIEVPNEYKLSIWIQDPFVVCREYSTDRTLFLETESTGTLFFEDDIVETASLAISGSVSGTSLLFLRGGNILAGDDFVLVGQDHLTQWVEVILRSEITSDVGEAKQILVDLFAREVDSHRRLIFLGSNQEVSKFERRDFYMTGGERWTELVNWGTVSDSPRQPIFHIDMFISLLGHIDGPSSEFVIMVGDPKLAAEMLGVDPPSHLPQIAFDDIANYLKDQGFSVVRNPLPLIYADDVKSKVRSWYYATSNNCLTENLPDGRKTVWLPVYGFGSWSELSIIDQENIRLWESFGFDVVPVGDFHPIASRHGALHCISKCIRRS